MSKKRSHSPSEPFYGWPRYKNISKVLNVKKTLSQWPQTTKKRQLDTGSKTIARVMEKHIENRAKNTVQHAREAL